MLLYAFARSALDEYEEFYIIAEDIDDAMQIVMEHEDSLLAGDMTRVPLTATQPSTWEFTRGWSHIASSVLNTRYTVTAYPIKRGIVGT
jgi:hypothetical protein